MEFRIYWSRKKYRLILILKHKLTKESTTLCTNKINSYLALPVSIKTCVKVIPGKFPLLIILKQPGGMFGCVRLDAFPIDVVSTGF